MDFELEFKMEIKNIIWNGIEIEFWTGISKYNWHWIMKSSLNLE